MWLKHYKLNEHEQRLLDMSEDEFDKYMMETYPEMFKLRTHKHMDDEGRHIILPMNFGFAIGPGWRHVLDTACRKCAAIKALTGYYPVFDQIKEKFGSARFYFHIEAEEGRESLRSDQEWCDLISDIINGAEEYTCYVCERLGTNVREDEKVCYPSWVYGMSVEGFKKWVVETWGEEDGQKRIEIAEKCTEARNRYRKLKETLGYLSDDEISQISAAADAFIEARKAAAKTATSDMKCCED